MHCFGRFCPDNCHQSFDISILNMHNMITASLIINILVLIPVCLSLLLNLEKMNVAAGIFTPARGILLAIYISILFASSFLLFFMDVKLAFALFSIQIVYKVLTPFTVKSIKNPIVISNLVIATFHLVTVITIMKSGLLHFDF